MLRTRWSARWCAVFLAVARVSGGGPWECPPDTSTVLGHSGDAGSVDGVGTSARLAWPSGLAVNAGEGTLYVADQDSHAIRTVSLSSFVSSTGELAAAWTVSTLAGGRGAGSTDGEGSLAGSLLPTGNRFAGLLHFPFGVALGPRGVVAVADTVNHAIRLVAPDGAVSTLAGGGNVSGDAVGVGDGVGTAATFVKPRGVAVDADGGVVYVVEELSHRLRAVRLATGSVSVLAGGGGNGSDSGAADGVGTSASFLLPHGVTLGTCAASAAAAGGAQALWRSDAAAPLGAALCAVVVDSGNNKLRVVATGSGSTVSLVGGGATGSESGARDGPAAVALLHNPIGAAFDGDTVYIADAYNHVVRALRGGVLSTAVGVLGARGTFATLLNAPLAVAVVQGGLLVADGGNHRIQRVVWRSGCFAPGAACASDAACAGGACRGGACCTLPALHAGCAVCALGVGSCATRGLTEGCAVDADCTSGVCCKEPTAAAANASACCARAT